MTNFTKSEVHLQSMSWYHGSISREKAEELLKPREDGLFLIRESVNYPGDFTLCVCFQGGVQHYRIIFEAEQKYSIDEEEYFSSLVLLVEYYTSDANGLITCLIKALPKFGLPIYPPVIPYFQKAGWVFPKKGLILEECLAKCMLQNSRLTFVGVKEASVMTTLIYLLTEYMNASGTRSGLVTQVPAQ